MIEWVQGTEGIWQYIGIFLLSILPFLDVFYVIPVGVALGMSPITVGIISFLGNFLMLLLFAAFFKQIHEWRKRRKHKKYGDAETETKREKKARRIWDKYGLPVFAVLSPSLLGTDIAAVMALIFGSSKSKVIAWMGVSLFVWSVVMVYISIYGFEYLGIIGQQ